MDLVRDDGDAVSCTDVKHALQLTSRPHAADGVVRAAQHEHGVRGVRGLALQVVEVHAVARRAVRTVHHERVPHDAPAAGLDRHEERVVHRRLHDDAVARARERAHRVEDRGHHARRRHHPLALGRPAMAALLPAKARGEELVRGVRVAHDGAIQPVAKRLLHLRRVLKLHVRHGKRHDVWPQIGLVAIHLLPLCRSRAAALWQSLKVVVHGVPPSCLMLGIIS